MNTQRLLVNIVGQTQSSDPNSKEGRRKAKKYLENDPAPLNHIKGGGCPANAPISTTGIKP